MDWTGQQSQSLKDVEAWLKNPSKQVFRLFGYAGTGKTTMAKEIEGMVNGLVLYMAFTGKAALVMRKKGCKDAGTIHSSIYMATDGPNGDTIFALNEASIVSMAKLVILDEASMVNGELGQDLLSFGTKVLVLGDPFQLKPVSGTGFFMGPNPDAMLTDIRRQAADNPIVRMSMDVREGRRLQYGTYGDSVILRKGATPRELVRDYVMGADQILCGLNASRLSYNERYRQLKGLRGLQYPEIPVAGDRLVCLRNNSEKGLLNGGLWVVRNSHHSDGYLELMVDSLDDEKIAINVSVPEEFFTGKEKDLDKRTLMECDHFTYGYALTVHKSQGSQWDNVMLFDESGAFRADAPNHLYTAITRAAERITIVM